MRAAAAFWVAAVTMVAGGRADPPTRDPDEKRFQGTWEIVSSVDGGEKLTHETGGRVIVAADKLTLSIGDRTEEFRYKLDATKTPQWLDLVADKATVIPCIYEFDGDALRIRFPRGGKVRPTEFEPKKDATNVRLLSLKRVK